MKIQTQTSPVGVRRSWKSFAVRAVAAVAVVGLATAVRADVDPAIAGIVENAETLFGSVKTLVIAVVAFFLLLAFAKRVRAK